MKIKLVLIFIAALLYMSCSKPSEGEEDVTLPGEEYLVEISNLSFTEGEFVAESSVESKTVKLKGGTTSKVSLHAIIGESVKFSVVLPAGGGIRVLDKMGLEIARYPSLTEYKDLYFIAFDPASTNKAPFVYKTGLAKNAVDVLFRKTFIIDKRYTIDNGVSTNSPLMTPCVADDQFEFTEYQENWMNMPPGTLVTKVVVKHGPSKCDYWPDYIALPEGNLTYFKNGQTELMMPVLDPANPEYRYYGLVKLQLDSISAVHQTLTLHKDISATAKDVFVYRRIN